MTIEQLWNLAQAWYDDWLSPTFRRRTLEDDEMIFRRLGFQSPFWNATAPGATYGQSTVAIATATHTNGDGAHR